jgi:hypothetical protein
MKPCLSKALIYYLFAMFAILMIKPKGFYHNDGKTLKGWKEIDFNNTDSLCNIYIYAVIIGIVCYHLSNDT